MSALDNVHLDVTALGRKIVLTRRSKRDPRLSLENKDIASEFWHALVQFVGVGNEVQFGGGDEQFVVRLTKATTAPDEPAERRDDARGRV